MSDNFSTPSLIFHPQLPTTSSFLAESPLCFISRPSSYVFVAFYLTNFLLIFPLIVLILYSALKEWQQKRNSASASTMSHFDCFIYNVVIMEIIGILRCVPYCAGIYTDNLVIIFVGGLLSTFIWYGETFFHVLTCVERYLAVVHPITYLGLRNDRGIRIRNVSVCFVWLLCFLRMIIFTRKEGFLIVDSCLLVLAISITAFCSLSVLCVLIRPGPGLPSSERVDQSKQRALYTIVTILSVLMLRFLASMGWNIMYVTEKEKQCLIMACIIWLNIPTSLVLPLLFLHRAGKFRCCKKHF